MENRKGPEKAENYDRIAREVFLPIFPLIAMESRLRWAGVDPADVELITSYETSHYCKPDLGYFREVVTNVAGFPIKPSGEAIRYLMKKYGMQPDETWYVGDRAIDVLCAKDAGVRSILLLPEGSYVTPTGHEDRIVRSLYEI